MVLDIIIGVIMKYWIFNKLDETLIVIVNNNGLQSFIDQLFNQLGSQLASQQVDEAVVYFASTGLSVTAAWFLLNKEIISEPKLKQFWEVPFCVTMSLSQSESTNPCSSYSTSQEC